MAVNEEKDTTGFAQRLKKLRIEKDLSQNELAELIQVHSNNISRYERGESRPTAKALKALADALGVSTDFLYDGEEEDAAVADLKDRELLEMFSEIENFPDTDKETIKNIIDAFIQKNKHQKVSSESRQRIPV